MKPFCKKTERTCADGALSFKLMSFMTVAFAALALTMQASQPAWWNSSGAVVYQPQIITNNGIVTTNNYYAVNQGQLKQFTEKAVGELNDNANLTNLGGAGPDLSNLVYGWHQDYLTNGYATNTANPTRPYKPSDYQAMNLGQLKYVGSMIWTRLITVGYTNSFPAWIVANTNTDYQVANIGQLKAVFNFDLDYDSDTNGLPDWWEMKYFGHLGNATNTSPTTNGLTVLQDYHQGNDPFNYYSQGGHTIAPTIAVISGNGQTSAPGDFLTNALVVKVTDGSGNPMTNAPVTFYSDEGQLNSALSGTGLGSWLQTTTGTNGLAQAYFLQPMLAGATNTITAMTSSNGLASQIGFTAATAADTASPIAPSGGSAIPGPETGEIDLSWFNNADNISNFVIQSSTDNATWTTIATLTDLTATSYAVTGLTIDQPYFFRISAGSSSYSEISSLAGEGVGTLPGKVIPPRYGVIDLGESVFPHKVTNSGHVLCNPGSVWRQGTSITLNPLHSGDNFIANDIAEDGKVVGEEYGEDLNFSLPELAVWSSGSSSPALSTGPVITNPDYELFVEGATYTMGMLISSIDDDIWSYSFNPDAQLDGYKNQNGNELGTITLDFSGTAIFPKGINNQGDLLSYNQDYDTSSNSWYMNSVALNFSSNGSGSCSISNEIGGHVFVSGVDPAYSSYYTVYDISGSSIVSTKHIPIPVGASQASYVNAKTVMVGGSPVPAIQLLAGGDYLWDMNSATGTFNSPNTLESLTTQSGWSGFLAHGARNEINGQLINDDGLIGATANGHGVLLVPAEIDVDYNRDGKIEPSTIAGTADAGRIADGNPWRFWIDDSTENGDIGGNDIPGSGLTDPDSVAPLANYVQSNVQGMRDLINYFPVYLDIGKLLQVLPPSTFTYKIKQADGAVNFVLTDLTPDKSGQYLKSNPISNGANLDSPSTLQHASIFHAISSGVALSATWLAKVRDSGEGVILVSGRAQTTNPLVLEVSNSSGQVLSKLQLPLSIDGIEKMYRTKNLRSFLLVGNPTSHTTMGPPDSTGEPANYPDILTNGKNLIFVHGYFVGGDASRGWNSEMFKRFFWSGSKAKFHGIEWFSDPYTTGSQAPQYHDAVINAFTASPALTHYVNKLAGSKVIVAHSLGNMLVSSAIKDQGMTVDKYILIDAAVAEEAYDASISADYEGMAHPDWIDGSFSPIYSTTLWATEWNQLFSSGDGRQGLTWRDRFAGVVGYNFYSSTEDVLGRFTGKPGTSAAVQVGLNGGQFGWNLQEKLKGRRVDIGVAAIGSLYGGWQFNLTDPANPSDPIYYDVHDTGNALTSYREPLPQASLGFATSTLLKHIPFFDPGFGETPTALQPGTGNTANTAGPAWIRDLYDATNGSSTAATYSQRAILLAQAFPALTDATGQNSISAFTLGGGDNFNMPSLYIQGTAWPSIRAEHGGVRDWFHNDIKEVGYPYLYSIFDKFVDTGGLND